MYSNEDVLIECEAVSAAGKLIKKIEQLEKVFLVSFDFCHSGRTYCRWQNLFHFTTQDSNSVVDGHDIPGVWYVNNRLVIQFSRNGDPSYTLGDIPFTPYRWHNVEIHQEKIDNDFVVSLKFDGQNISQIVNTQPKVYKDVKVYVSNPWDPSAVGKVRHLKLCYGTKFDPDLQCPQCKKMFVDPILLDCGETLCRNCVEKLAGDARAGTVACPVCHFATSVRDTGLLWKDKVRKRKLDAIKLKKGSSIKCSDCEESAAKEFCLDCKSIFCAECAAHHRKAVRSKKHKMDNITAVSENDLQSATVRVCERHGKLIEYFCEQCKSPTCYDCGRSKAHRGHEMLLLDEIIEEDLSSLKELLAKLQEKWNEYEISIKNMEECLNIAAEKKEKSRIVIQQTFDEIRAELQKTEEESLKWLDEPYGAAVVKLQRVKDLFTIGKGRTQYIAKLTALPSNGDTGVISEAKKWVGDTCKQVSAALLNEEAGERSMYGLWRELVTHEVSSVDQDCAGVVEMMLDGAKKISFQQIITRRKTADKSGTF